jgi:hypothetical protein
LVTDNCLERDPLETLKLIGLSDAAYYFGVHPYSSTWSDPGVYVVSKRGVVDGVVRHRLLYLGDTDNFIKSWTGHPQKNCFDKHEAGALCFLRCEDEGGRTFIRNDLIEAYLWPCNESGSAPK